MQTLFEFAKKVETPRTANAPAKVFSAEVTSGTAARVLRVSQSTVGRLCEEGRLRAWRLADAGWWRIDYASLIELLAERRG